MSRGRDESGAVAILVALLAVVLIGMLAFTADFGIAYANKRQMQTAADAAALGAAGVFAQQPGNTCASILASGSGAANSEAEALETANEPASGTSDLTYPLPECDADGLVVRATVGGTSPTFFGGLFGDTDGYTTFRSAAAVVEAAATVGAGLRPLAVCSKDLTSMGTYPTPVMKLSFPESGHVDSACPDSESPGNWWTLDCPEDNGNDIATNITQGCDDPVTIVPGQPAPSPALGSYLTGYCANPDDHPESCLRSNPGNLRDNNSEAAFNSLIASRETFFLPVFCGTPHCDPQGISDDSGGNVIYPVHKLIAVQLCGFHFGPKKGADMTGLCANNPSGHTVNVTGPGAAQANFLLAVVVQVQVSGGTAPSGCRIGDPCDTGLRQVRMVDGGFDY